MARERDLIKRNRIALEGTDHDQPYRAETILYELNLVWHTHKDLRDECEADWRAIIEWCKADPACNDEKYFPEWKVWRDYFQDN